MPLPGLPRWLMLVMVLPLIRQPAAAWAQAAAECPAAAARVLQTTHGSWDVTWRDRVAPGRYDTTRARATIEPTAGGCGVLERFAGSRDGQPFSAVTLIGPAADDTLERVWQDSGHGVLLVFTGSAARRPLRFEWSRRLGERTMRLRHTYLTIAPDSFVTETELSTDDGRSWAVVAHLLYRRRAP